jgi:hypothetical protein
MTLIEFPANRLRYPIPAFDYQDCVLAGGAIRDSIQDIAPKDLDIFGPSRERLEAFAERNLKDYRPVYESQFSLTYVKTTPTMGEFTVLETGEKINEIKTSVQLVFFRPYHNHEQLVGDFPFTINQFTFDGNVVRATPDAIIDSFLRRCRINHLRKADVYDTLLRIDRYHRKGYEVGPEVIPEVMKVIQTLTPTEMEQYSVRPKGISFGGY